MVFVYSSIYQNRNGSVPNTKQSICRKYASFYPTFNPSINTLSVNDCSAGVYTLVYVNGANFLPNNSYVSLGGFINLSVTFYTSSAISFVVPYNITAGVYKVTVINKYNGNFGPSINNSYSGHSCYSNSVLFTVFPVNQSPSIK